MKPTAKRNLKKSAAAVIACIATGISTTTHAVHINANGTGQALVFPYYTVRAVDGATSTAFYDTYVSVTNTTPTTKALKVRFLEGKRGAEVLTFNVYLGGFDVWTGAVIRTPIGARLISKDTSCVVPLNLFNSTQPFTDQTTPSVFKNFAYSSDSNGDLDRVREGHFEILEMGVVTEVALVAAIKHQSNGVPLNCGLIAAREADATAPVGATLQAPTGGLYGGASIINVLGGIDYSYDAVAFQNWYDPRAGSIWTPSAVDYVANGQRIVATTNNPNPTVISGGSLVSDVFTAQGDKISSTWGNARDAISATMMHEAVTNDYVLDSGTRSGTDWVVTMPTKQFYSRPGTGVAAAPFNVNYNTTKNTAGDRIKFSFFNREEAAPIGAPPDQIVCTPPPPTPQAIINFCWSANAMTFNNSNTLGATNVLNITVPYQNGWATVRFEEPFNVLTPTSTTVNGAPSPPLTHFGLPVVGFMVQDFINASVPSTTGGAPVFSVYGGQFTHKFKTRIGVR